MREITVYDLPSCVGSGELDGAAAVVIDVLRATTTIIMALAAGAREVRPMLDIDEARLLRKDAAPGSVLLGGERNGVRIEGFDLANSPSEYTPETIGNKTLIFTTTNGTVAMHAARPAQNILLAGFVNAAAVVAKLREVGRVAVLCAGTDGEPTEEDRLVAGCLVSRLTRNAPEAWRLSGSADDVRRIWDNEFVSKTGEGVRETVSPGRLEELLRQSRGGLNLVQLGLDADIALACRLDSLETVPVLDPARMFATVSG